MLLKPLHFGSRLLPQEEKFFINDIMFLIES